MRRRRTTATTNCSCATSCRRAACCSAPHLLVRHVGADQAFFDRSFSHYAGSGDGPEDVKTRMQGKRLGLAVASEETYPGAALGIVHQIQEFARYTHSDFVGFVHGAGNSRGEIAADPRQPLLAARTLGAEFFTRKYSDYRIETPRSHTVWESPVAAPTARA